MEHTFVVKRSYQCHTKKQDYTHVISVAKNDIISEHIMQTKQHYWVHVRTAIAATNRITGTQSAHKRKSFGNPKSLRLYW